MKTLYLDCGMGAAGDMLTAALLELCPNPQAVVDQLNALGLPGVHTRAESAVSCGITGTHVRVTVNGEEEESLDVHDHAHSHEHVHDHEHEHNHEHSHDHDHAHSHEHGHEHGHDHEHGGHHHHHTGMDEIRALTAAMPLPEKVRQDVLDVYGLIAAAESHAHGMPVEQVHFHEVGTLDALADVTAVCLLMHQLAPDRVVASPVHVGCGHVHCAHGVLPVPAPATAYILQGVPIYGGSIQGELCTPTGAALLKHFAHEFGPMPMMTVEKIGYGMGTKQFEAANCVRAMLGNTASGGDEVMQLECNLDDMTPEAVAYAQQLLLDAGALDVFTTPAGMKKGRPGLVLTCLCRPDQADALAGAMLLHTSTLGVRSHVCRRYTLERTVETVDTLWGPVRRKWARGCGAEKCKWEYEDLARIAKEQKLPLEQVVRQLDQSFGKQK